MENLSNTQQAVVDTRSQQPTNLADLEVSRGVEGYNTARAALADTTQKINDYNATVANVETQVRNEYANSNLTESEIQAEVTNRTRQLIPQGQRLQAAYNTAKANYDISTQAVTDRFNAVRADAAEAVNRVMQQYGFSQDNLKLSVDMMTGLKNYELQTDAQKNSQRDAARAYAVQAMSTPGMLQRMSAQDIANLEASAQFYPGTLAGVRDNLASGKMLAGQLDDYGNFVYVMQGANGTLSFGRKNQFAAIAPKVSAASVAASESFANSTSGYRAVRNAKISDLWNKNATKTLSTSERQQELFQTAIALQKAATETGNPADMKDARTFMAAWAGSTSELTADQLSAQITTILEQQTGQ
jgi:hypothetical protein